MTANAESATLTTGSSTTYDLRPLQLETRHWRLFVRAYLSGVGIGIAALLFAIVIAQTARHDWLIVAVGTFGLVTAPSFLLWIANVKYSTGPERISLASDGITVTFGGGVIRQLNWGDPDLKFKLIDGRIFRTPDTSRGRLGLVILDIPKTPFISIPPDLYDGIVAVARENSLHMDRRFAGTGNEKRVVLSIRAPP